MNGEGEDGIGWNLMGIGRSLTGAIAADGVFEGILCRPTGKEAVVANVLRISR